jgi:hypothetical protein
MAGLPRARVNNLNQRMHDVGIFDQDLTLEDATAINAFYGYTCLNCGAERSISLDHVKPIMSGGTNKRDNIQNLCESCNKAKGQKEIDYRKGRICPEDYAAPTAQTTRRNKVDWNAVRLQYVTGNMSIRDLAEIEGIPLRTLEYQACEINNWNKQREEHRYKVDTLSLQANAEKEVSARSLAFDVGVEIVQDWRRNSKRSTSAAEVAGILKVLLALQGQAGERIEHVEANVSEQELYARISSAFDAGEEEGSAASGADSGEEKGAGWTDQEWDTLE